MFEADPKVHRAMAMYQIRAYLNAVAPDARLSAADILDHLHAFKVAPPADRLQTLISAIEGKLARTPHDKIYDRIVKVAVKKNPDIPDIEAIIVPILAVVARYSKVENGRFTVSLALNQPQFR